MHQVNAALICARLANCCNCDDWPCKVRQVNAVLSLHAWSTLAIEAIVPLHYQVRQVNAEQGHHAYLTLGFRAFVPAPLPIASNQRYASSTPIFNSCEWSGCPYILQSQILQLRCLLPYIEKCIKSTHIRVRTSSQPLISKRLSLFIAKYVKLLL